MKKLLTTLLCFVMALSCVFGVAACAPTDDMGNTGVVTPGGDQPGETDQPGGDETPEPAPEPSEGLEFFCHRRRCREHERDFGLLLYPVLWAYRYKALQAAFMNCQSLKEVVLADGILTIGSAAFGYCLGLTEISIPESVTRINYYAFTGCCNLTAVSIPDSVTIIDDFAFDGCEKLTSIVIPDSVTEVGESAFEYCSSLTTVYYTGSEAEWNQIEIGSWNDDLLDAMILFIY